MKVLIAIFSIMIISFSSVGQSYSFMKTLDKETNLIVPAEDGHFYMISIRPNCGESYSYITYFNKAGNVIRSKVSDEYLAGFRGIQGLVTDNNSLIFYCKSGPSSHLIYEIDTLLNITWSSNFQFSNPKINYTQLVRTPTALYLSGNTEFLQASDTSKAIITKLSNTGIQQWTKYYEYTAGALRTNFQDILVDNNTLVAAGSFEVKRMSVSDKKGGEKPMVCLIDTNGNFINGKYFMVDSVAFGLDFFNQQQVEQIHQTPNGSFYLQTQGKQIQEHEIIKLNANLDIDWIKEAGDYIGGMCAGYDEDILVCPELLQDNAIIHMDSTGQNVSNHITQYISTNDIQYGQVTSIHKQSCGFLLGNNENFYARMDRQNTYCKDSTISNLWLQYRDLSNFYEEPVSISGQTMANGNSFIFTVPFFQFQMSQTSICSESFACSNPESIRELSKVPIKIYPNPSSDIIKIEVPENLALDYEINLYNSFGQLLSSEQVKNKKSIELNFSQYASGVYWLFFKSSESFATGKIVIQH